MNFRTSNGRRLNYVLVQNQTNANNNPLLTFLKVSFTDRKP